MASPVRSRDARRRPSRIVGAVAAGVGTVLTAACVVVGCAPPSTAADARVVRVAVAANFARPFAELASAFTARDAGGQSGHGGGGRVRLESAIGSTGALFAQIENGAPFDLFLAADRERPERLAGVATPFTYAIGRLLLVGASAPQALLDAPAGARIAIANPATAPYGRAAREALTAFGLTDDVAAARIVHGGNVAQALQLVVAGAAPFGIVARSDRDRARAAGLATWDVPVTMHAPIRQDAIALSSGRGVAADVEAFVAFLVEDDEAIAILVRHGYERGEGG